MRPVLAGICQYVWLVRGQVNLVDMSRMNDALDVRARNDRDLAPAPPPRKR